MAAGEEVSDLAEALGNEPATVHQRRTAHEYVRETLRSGILRGRLKGGTRLVQTEVAEQLGVSTTPVREALRDLATEGLVRLDAHRGGVVNQLTFEDLRQIHELFRLVEPEAMRQVAGIVDDELIERARALAERMREETDPALWTELNRDFHACFLDATPSSRIRNLLRGLRDSVAPYVALAVRRQGKEQFDTANQQHAQILEAMEVRDADRCAELTRTHVDLTVRALEQSREHFSDGQEPELR